ncbi:lipase family protein [Frankia sp. Cj5]|uniref:lipase family protein n=1 Tax=Frankia sp. Cj5 TaxID=2880978 RepID=UPI001EF6DD49|nr:lipase family protein [Frankia sp. Cj5]
MRIYNYQGPDFETFRPYKRTDPGVTFPLYDNLSNLLAEAGGKEQSETIRNVMAICAGYTYGAIDITDKIRPESSAHRSSNAVTTYPSNILADMMVRAGLDRNSCRVVDERIDSMFIYSTAFIVQSIDRKVLILAYRGTEPANILNWFTALDVTAQDHRKARLDFDPDDNRPGEPFDVHMGFYRNTRVTAYEVLRTLRRGLAGESILSDSTRNPKVTPGKDPALYITGHSLGGAMAAFMALKLISDPTYREIREKLRGVYTFGQPMIGSAKLAEAYSHIPEVDRPPIFRYIYRDDPIPHYPPRSTGDFAHFGSEFRYNGNWEPSSNSQQMGNVLDLATAAAEFPLQQLHILDSILPLVTSTDFSIAHHFPQNYIQALTPVGRPNELGDDQILPEPGIQQTQRAGQVPGLPKIRESLQDLVRDTIREAVGESVAEGMRTFAEQLPAFPINVAKGVFKPFRDRAPRIPRIPVKLPLVG